MTEDVKLAMACHQPEQSDRVPRRSLKIFSACSKLPVLLPKWQACCRRCNPVVVVDEARASNFRDPGTLTTALKSSAVDENLAVSCIMRQGVKPALRWRTRLLVRRQQVSRPVVRTRMPKPPKSVAVTRRCPAAVLEHITGRMKDAWRNQK